MVWPDVGSCAKWKKHPVSDARRCSPPTAPTALTVDPPVRSEDKGGFDIISLSYVLATLPHEEVGPFMAECKSALRPGGHLLLVCPRVGQRTRGCTPL